MGRRTRATSRSAKRRRSIARPKVRKTVAGIAELREQLNRRTLELDNALQQQTATSEVLSIIRQSPADAQPVFDAIVQSASRLCGAMFGVVYLCDGDRLRIAATNHFTPAATIQLNELQQLKRPERSHLGGRAILERKIIHVPDVLEDPEYSREFALAGGWRAVLAVPLMRDGIPLGALTAAKAEPAPFSDRQIQLLKTFAEQAVIAIENTRLLNELRESLQQQTATADVLKVISGSAFELKTVFNALVESAMHLCEAGAATIWRPDGQVLRLAANSGFSSEFDSYCRENPITPGRGTVTARVAIEGKLLHVPDVLADPELAPSPYVSHGKFRSALGVPLLKNGQTVGVFVLTRPEVRPYTDKQIELVKTFADQAVIAIENARLLNELRDSLQQQTATGEILASISGSMTDAKPVFDAIVRNLLLLFGTRFAAVQLLKDGIIYMPAADGEPGFEKLTSYYPRPLDGTTMGGLAMLSRQVVQFSPIRGNPLAPPSTQKFADEFGFNSSIFAPMVRGGQVFGAIGVAQHEPRPFDEKQIALITSFANQAVIAIENARLFQSVEARTRELAKSLEELRTTQDRLVQTQKLALLGQLTAGIAHEIKNPLNFVNNFSGISTELIDELKDTLKGISLDDKARTEINELTDTLKSNFDKVVHHGRRADAIVKNMLQHSREGSGEHRVIDINALVEESLNLAWHGARAETQGFEIKLKQSFDPSAGGADVFPQDIRRALLNVISNGFYAATKRRAETDGGGYEPTLTASTKNLGDLVEIRIRDNGTGMTPDVKEKMFNPFFTTKPTGEGTGLGLSISHDIIVKQHAGSIEVDTQPGEFTEIRVVLPRVAALLSERS